MRNPPRFLFVLLLAGLFVRVALGAPCCLPGASAHGAEHSPVAAETAHHVMAMGHGDHGTMAAMDVDPADGDQSGHHEGGDNTANPCCSACGPTLSSAPPQLAASAATPQSYAETEREALAPRDLIRLYQATGPPLKV